VTTFLHFSALVAAQSSIGHYWHKITDRTFSGVYHANGFDLAMMIPYFIVLFILALCSGCAAAGDGMAARYRAAAYLQ
jgi:hypothetical protein